METNILRARSLVELFLSVFFSHDKLVKLGHDFSHHR